MVAAEKVVLVEVESIIISITTFLCYCPNVEKHLIIEHIFSRSSKDISPWQARITWEDLRRLHRAGDERFGLGAGGGSFSWAEASSSLERRGLGERTDRKVDSLGGTEQRSIAQFCSLTLDNWAFL